MDKRSQLILFSISLFGVISILLSCENDDICAEVSITPYLIIRFMDFEDQDDPDDISSLQVRYIGDPNNDADNDSLVFDGATTTDSITLSLPTTKDQVTYVFYQDFDDDNEDDLTETELDTIIFTYSRANEYVSRACGYKTIYSNFRASIGENTGNGFILGENVEQTTIEDEEEAHIRLFH